MKFNEHWRIKDAHAFLSASSPEWLNYDESKLTRVYTTAQAAARGTALHAFAAQAIKLKQRMPDNNLTINAYVNDAIGFRMTPEQILFFSENCFGTADAIGFDGEILRISDLKTGRTRVSFTQLKVYAALFCLEYRFTPMDLAQIELRVYQNDNAHLVIADPIEIASIMSNIIDKDRLIRKLREENES